WVEQDPKEILQSVYECIEKTSAPVSPGPSDPAAVVPSGSSVPAAGASSVWLDLRTQSTVESLSKRIPGNNNFVKSKTGLPLSTYFSAVKLRWLLDNVRKVQKAVEEDRALFGTIDSWLIWSLTGGASGGVHCTDVTNASRTMLFNIHSLEWDKELCEFFEIPMKILPNVRSSSEIYGLMKISHSPRIFPGILQGPPPLLGLTQKHKRNKILPHYLVGIFYFLKHLLCLVCPHALACCYLCSFLISALGWTSLVVQWLRLCMSNCLHSPFWSCSYILVGSEVLMQKCDIWVAVFLRGEIGKFFTGHVKLPDFVSVYTPLPLKHYQPIPEMRALSFPGGSVVKNLPANAGVTVRSLIPKDPTCRMVTKPLGLVSSAKWNKKDIEIRSSVVTSKNEA
ncbi:hypothetical protein FD755_015885, partial [Muntiacus reevesi]